MALERLNRNLHYHQGEVFRSPAQVRAVIAGRAFGKSVLMLLTAVQACLTYDEPINADSPQVALIAMPTLKMAKAIYWRPLLSMLEGCPAVEDINKSDYRITFKGQRPDLILRGADLQGERLRGLNLCFAGLDEYQGFEPIVWKEILDPALSRNENWRALVIGTPKGKLNHFYQFHLEAIANEGWQYFHFITADNPFFPKRHLERAKRELPAKVYRQEFEASFEDFEGQIATEARKELHLVPVTADTDEQYYIGVDPGVINPAMVLFSVSPSYRFTVHDRHYENTGEAYTTDDLVRLTAALIAKCDRPIKRIFVPDDRADLVKTFRNAGYRQTILVKRNRPSPIQRAEILNTLFKCGKLRFAHTQEPFFDEVLSYHRDVDRSGNVVEAIALGQVDHSVDALLYGVGRLCMDYPMLLPMPDKLLPTLPDVA